jgi:predicted ATPase
MQRNAMITNMRMHNFKSWADTGEIPLAPLTGFFGTNSSGKTSLLQMLLLMKQTTESSDRSLLLHTGGEKVGQINLGTPRDVVHSGQDRMMFSLSWGLPNPIRISEPDFQLESLTFTTEIIVTSDQPFVREMRYESDGFQALMSRTEKDDNYHVKVTVNDKSAARPQARPRKNVPAPIKSYGFPQEAIRSFQNVDYLSDVVLEFERLFGRVYYLGPLRDYPQRFYTWGGSRPTDVGARGELAVAALLSAAKDSVYSGRGRQPKLLGAVGQWLKRMGMVESFTARPLVKGGTQYEVRVRQNSGSPEVLITDVGFGVSQMLPVLVLCYYCPPGSTLILEQPEIHLHPSVQADLADLFIDVIKRRHVQIILESHSEHLLRRLQLRIAELAITNDKTALYFCDMEGGKSRLKTLNLDEFGNIGNWPNDFFGDITGDLLAQAQKEIERQTAIS